MKKILLFILPVIYLLESCKDNEHYKATLHDPFIYSTTVKKLNDIVLENNFPPMIASRNYAYANIAAYEVIAAGDSNFASLAGQIRHLPAMPQPENPAETDFPFASMLAFCRVGNEVTFPEGSMDIYVEELKEKAKDGGMSSGIFKNSVAYADAVANKILAWSKEDNYAQLRSAPKFTVIDTPGRWMPTPPMYGQALEPHWMKIRTLVMDSASQFRAEAPPPCDIKDTACTFYRALMYVKNTTSNLTEEQKHIADFWDDNSFKLNVIGHVMYATKKFSPPGHWMNIVGIIAQKKQADFSTTVYAYAKTSIALFDGFISCWDEKYRSNYIRPETVINRFFDADWKPYIQTPPFPEYTSGHAVISASASEVMADIFGDNISFTDTSETEFGISPRSFTSIRQAAKEAADSRVLGGIHYQYSCEVGNKQGKKVGNLVIEKLQMRESDTKNGLAKK